MIRCPHCNSYAVEHTGRVLTSYPSYSVYKCNDCGKEFNICNNEKIPCIDLSKSEVVTERLKFDFFKSILETGEIPYTLSYYGKEYYFYKALYLLYLMNEYKFYHLLKEL